MEVEVCLVDGVAEIAVDHGVEEVSLDGGGMSEGRMRRPGEELVS